MGENLMDAALRCDLLANGAKESSWMQLARLFFTSPDFKTVLHYRLYSRLCARPGIKRILGRLLYAHAVHKSACHISPLARAGEGLRLMHATGIVIGTGVKIGTNVTIYQNVTLGQRREGGEYPEIGDGVIVYAGACVLGGIKIGRNAVIGANAVVLDDVPENATAAGAPARVTGNIPAIKNAR